MRQKQDARRRESLRTIHQPSWSEQNRARSLMHQRGWVEVVRLAKRTAVHDHGTALAEWFSASFGGMINDRSTYDMH